MTLQLNVPNMACEACGQTITEAIQTIDPMAQVKADPKTKQVKVETLASEVAIKAAIADAGYTVS